VRFLDNGARLALAATDEDGSGDDDNIVAAGTRSSSWAR
jgi:hypothetical protein